MLNVLHTRKGREYSTLSNHGGTRQSSCTRWRPLNQNQYDDDKFPTFIFKYYAFHRNVTIQTMLCYVFVSFCYQHPIHSCSFLPFHRYSHTHAQKKQGLGQTEQVFTGSYPFHVRPQREQSSLTRFTP